MASGFREYFILPHPVYGALFANILVILQQIFVKKNFRAYFLYCS